jgi:N,N'-diacetyllegionaminate synthase
MKATGNKKRTIIIAEAGECWNGEIGQAKKLIEISAQAECDYIKFQTLDKETIKDSDPERDWFLKIALTEKMIERFIKYADKNRIRPLFTPANLKKARMLKEKFGREEVKIASSVFHNKETVQYIAENYKTIFLSTGMSSLKEIKVGLNCFKKRDIDLYILHCISEYPTGLLLEKNGLMPLAEENVHLNMMLILKKSFPRYKIGYSDHTVGLLTPICAVAAGAEVIEKHITLNRSEPIKLYKSSRGYLGTDHVLSLEPTELKEMVRQIRQVEKIFGEWKWERTAGERILRPFLIGRF